MDFILEKSEITKYFKGKSVLLTGATGFIGQLYLEKLLRIGVKCVYVLARSKKNKSAAERIRDLCKGKVFEKLSQIDANFIDRIIVVEGDIAYKRIGLSNSDCKALSDNVNIVIHAAADVRFLETLYDLINVNLRGTIEILELSNGFRKLELFVYISTAYSHCPRLDVEEMFYDVPFDPFDMVKVVDCVTKTKDEDNFEIFTSRLINPWPNTYTYSKALSEEAVRKYGDKFQVVVIRPSIVTPTWKDPLPNWSNNLNALNGTVAAVGAGLLHVIKCDTNGFCQIICADMVVNSTLVIAHDIHKKMIDQNEQKILQPSVYNVSTNNATYVKLHGSQRLLLNNADEAVTSKSIWYPFSFHVKNEFLFRLFTIIFQVIPAVLFDLIRPKNRHTLLSIYRKIQMMSQATEFAVCWPINFYNPKMEQIYNEMTDEDSECYPCDLRKVDWHSYFHGYVIGVRKFVFKEKLHTTRLFYLKTIHYMVKFLLIAFAMYTLYCYAGKVVNDIDFNDIRKIII